MEAVLSADFLKFFVPLVGAVVAWWINEQRKLAWEQYERKEQRYRELLRTLRGFYTEGQDRELKQAFLDQINECWLYCPDDVIRKAYTFLSTVRTGAGSTDELKAMSCGELVLAVRKDLLSRTPVRKTELSAHDFQHLRAT